MELPCAPLRACACVCVRVSVDKVSDCVVSVLWTVEDIKVEDNGTVEQILVPPVIFRAAFGFRVDKCHGNKSDG